MTDTGFVSVLAVAVGLSADCFAVALSSAIAVGRFGWRRFFRFPLAFGIFQALMVVIGWMVGRSVIDFIASFDHWLAFGLLVFIGGRMVWESFHEKDETKVKRNIDSWFTLLALAVATSIDALAVGLSFAFLKIDIVLACATIGITTLVITAIAQLVGRWVGKLAGRSAEIVGGVILIAIGMKILLEHLL